MENTFGLFSSADTDMYCVSVSYKQADVNVRGQFAFTEDERRELLQKIVDKDIIDQAVLVCTCNRTEVYFFGKKKGVNRVEELLSDFAKVDQSQLLTYARVYYGNRAIAYLYRVTCGMESMVVGEDEIFRQVRDAYEEAEELSFIAYEFHVIFQGAFACAKKIKTVTQISKSSVSTATLAAKAAAGFADKVKVVLIGGTGKIGIITLKNLLSYRNVEVITTVRQHNSVLSSLKDNDNCTLVSYKDRYKYFDDADCIVSATASPHYTVTAHELQKVLKTDKERLYIDLAVPQDIDEKVAQLSGATLYDIDYFEELAKANNELKLSSIEAAKEIIDEDVDAVKKALVLHNFMPQKNEVLSKYKNKSLEQVVFKMRDGLSSDEFIHFLNILSEE